MEREEREREAQALHIPTPVFRFVQEVVRRGGGRGATPPRGWRRDWRGGELQPRCGALSQNSANMSAKIKVEHESPKNETKSAYI